MSSSLNRNLLQNLLRSGARTSTAVYPSANHSQLRNYSQLVNKTVYPAAHNFSNVLAAASSQFSGIPSGIRAFSDKTDEEKENKENEETNNAAEEESADSEEEEVSEVEKLEGQLKEMKDQLLRSLAEQENIRRIAKRDVENARNFAVSSFAKSLLDTSDNLSRAMEAVPEEFRTDTENHPVLATLYEGIQMTDDGLTKAFGKNGLKKFGASGDKFDPNMHEALFEYPDENMEAGTVGQVMKVGFSLNDRVIRPAEVGITKKA
jgi:molecular chaperone GrpE